MTSPPVLSTAEAELRDVMDDFVNVYERLDEADDQETKPNYSYTEMIYLAILRSPNFCLPITEIYKYIRNRFSFFRSSARKHWCNAVRHSLSKTKCFAKIAVGRGSSGNTRLNRSTYLWCIVPGSIVHFARGDYRPNVDTESGTNTLRWGYFRVNAGQFWDQVAVYLDKKMEIFRQLVMTTSSPGKVLEAQACYVTGCAKTSQKSSASNNLFLDSAKTLNQPTHTVHHEPNHDTSRNISYIGTSGHSLILKSPIQDENTSRDSGNGSFLEPTPVEKRRRLANSIPETNGISFISQNTQVSDDTRKTPELPDLGHVSPLTVSPALSPVGNISFDSITGTSFSPFLHSAPAYASTPVVTSFAQQRSSQVAPQYNLSISPPLFPPPPYPISKENPLMSGPSSGYYYLPQVPPISKPIPLSYLQPNASSPLASHHGMYMPHGMQHPSMQFPYQTGAFDFGSFPSSYTSQMPYQYDTSGYQSIVSPSENRNILPLNLQPKLDSISTATGAVDSLDWGSV